MQSENRDVQLEALVRAFTIVLLLAGGLSFFTTVLDDGDPTQVSTLLQRIGAGAVLSLLFGGLIVRWTRPSRSRISVDAGLGPGRQALAMFGAGFAAWALPAALIFIVLALSGYPLQTSGDIAAIAGKIALVLFAVLLSEAIPEELVFRGYVTGALERFLGPWAVILAQTALFTGIAIALGGYTGLLDFSLLIAMGAAFGYLRLLTGSVWVPIGFHTAFQTGSQLLLTHDEIRFTGPRDLEIFALGVGPFALGIILLSALVHSRTSAWS